MQIIGEYLLPMVKWNGGEENWVLVRVVETSNKKVFKIGDRGDYKEMSRCVFDAYKTNCEENYKNLPAYIRGE
tara:strand:+ start:39836 stop:40054 length:219 start_codon:yes stop_codon:yes gene_type:complete